MTEKLKVVLLFGGQSGEHEVSLKSARSVMEALNPQRYDTIPVGITREGAWIVGDAGSDLLDLLRREDLDAVRPAVIFGDPSRRGLWIVDSGDGAQKLELLSRVDVVFPVLHGTFGEDGTLQGLLELAGVPYVGAGVLASAVGMDKLLFKSVCRAHGLPVADFVGATRRRWLEEPEAVVAEVEEALGYPVFTKPANLGSSVGITKCRDREALRLGINRATQYDRRILVEEAVPAAREIEVSVLGNETPSASIPGEIMPSREFYDYAAKYLDVGDAASELLIPAPLDDESVARIQEIAIRAYRAIDGAGMARVDFLLSRETGELYLNELNTIPGFTPISMYPKLWDASRLPYPQLLSRLIDLALERHEENVRSVRVYRPGKET